MMQWARRLLGTSWMRTTGGRARSSSRRSPRSDISTGPITSDDLTTLFVRCRLLAGRLCPTRISDSSGEDTRVRCLLLSSSFSRTGRTARSDAC